MGGVNAAKEGQKMIQKQVRILENRLDKALVKFNEALANNKRLREVLIHHLFISLSHPHIYSQISLSISLYLSLSISLSLTHTHRPSITCVASGLCSTTFTGRWKRICTRRRSRWPTSSSSLTWLMKHVIKHRYVIVCVLIETNVYRPEVLYFMCVVYLIKMKCW